MTADEWLDKLNQALIARLSDVLKVPVYQDNVTNQELKKECDGIYHYVLFVTGGMRRVEGKKFTLIQDVRIFYYAEGVKDDLDPVQVAVIRALEGLPYTFIQSEKAALQKGSEDAYVDGITFTFTRPIKYVCEE